MALDTSVAEEHERTLRVLRWLTILLPVAAVLVADLSAALLGPHVGEVMAHGLVGLALVILIVPFSIFVLRSFIRMYATLTERNRALSTLQQHTAQQGERLRALDEAGLALVSELSMQAVLQRVVSLSRELVHARSARLEVLDDRLPATQPLTSGHLERSGAEADRARSLSIPIAYKDVVIGNLLVSEKEDGAFTPEDESLLTLFAAHAAVAVATAHMHADIESYATLEERARISRETHDGFAQVLGYVSTKAQAAEEFAAAGQYDDTRVQLHELREAVGMLYTDVREVIFNLRSANAGGRDLDGDLAAYVQQFRQYSGIDVHFYADVERRAMPSDPGTQAHVMRVVQEALTNVRKHARASRAWVRVTAEDGELQVAVTDNGVGFSADLDDPSRTQFGLRTMRERAELIGAVLSITSAPGGGTSLVLRLPG